MRGKPDAAIVPRGSIPLIHVIVNLVAPKFRRGVVPHPGIGIHELGLIAQKFIKAHVVVASFALLMREKSALASISFEAIIIDEAHRLKGTNNQLSTRLEELDVNFRLLLTGTPLQNNLAELWSLLNFLLPKVFSSCDDFEKWFSMPLARIASDKEKCDLSEEEKLLIINRLHQVLRPFLLRRVKKEVESEIPNKVEHVLKIELSAWQKIVYNQIKDNGVLSRDPTTGKIGTKALMNLLLSM